MFLFSFAMAQELSPESARWASDARRQITNRWSGCVDYIPPSVPMKAPSYTTVAELNVLPDGTPVDARITTPSGVQALDDCAISAIQQTGRFPVPPPAMIGSDGKAHLTEVTLTLNLAKTPTAAPAKGPLAEATRDPAATAAAVAAAPTRIGTSNNASRNIWCGGPGEKFACSIRDQRGSMLVFSVQVCHRENDLYFETAYGPMVVKGALDLVPNAKACPTD